MIKNIYLHIGLHKTGSSSIQVSLFKSKEVLKKYGYLYPEFKKEQNIIHNHSIPFYSLFTNNPLKYHINIKEGDNTVIKIEQLHKKYVEQFHEQIITFHGENLIISGEDISGLNAAQLQNLKTFLLEQVGQQAKIQVIVFVRNPLSSTQSIIQEKVKHGTEISEKNMQKIIEQKRFSRIFNQLFTVFSKTEIKVISFEEAIIHNNGPVGSFLSTIEAPKSLFEKINYTYANKSISYEALIILSAINKSQITKDELNNSYFKKPLKFTLFGIPGQKIILSDNIYHKIWESAQYDIEYLYKHFNIQYTQTATKSIKTSTIWNQNTLNYLSRIIPLLPLSVGKVICTEIYLELLRYYPRINRAQITRLILFLNSHKKLLNNNYQLPSISRFQLTIYKTLSFIGANNKRINKSLLGTSKRLETTLDKILNTQDQDILDAIQLYDGFWGY